MLDRKIKDIDAGVELLEDRLKADKIWVVFLSVFGMAFMSAGLYSQIVGDWFYMEFSLLMAVIMYIVCTWEILGMYHKSSLLFYRRYMKV